MKIKNAEPDEATTRVVLALRAWLAGDKRAVADIVKLTPEAELREFALTALQVAVSLLHQRRDPESFLAAVELVAAQNGAPDATNPTARAREYLRAELGDGKPKLKHELFADAMEKGVIPNDDRGRKALRNAADHLGIVTVRIDGGLAWRISLKARQKALVKRAEKLAR